MRQVQVKWMGMLKDLMLILNGRIPLKIMMFQGKQHHGKTSQIDTKLQDSSGK